MDVLSAIVSAIQQLKNWVDNNKVQKVSGKGLSTNDYTTEDKNKVSNMANDLVVINQKLYLAKDGVPIMGSEVTFPSGSSSGGIEIEDGIDVIFDCGGAPI